MTIFATGGGIFLIGSNGQLGHALQATLGALGPLTARDFPAIDLAHPDGLRQAIRALLPGLIVNAAAYTAVDKAESEPALAFAINAEGPRILAEEAAALGAALVHYSTDYVFDGTKAGAYGEEDTPAPLSVYGKSKLAGDRAVLGWSRSLVFRTAWVISAHGANFVKTMLRLACTRDRLRVVDDQLGAPTSAALLARTTAVVLSQLRDVGEDRWGLYHLAAAGETSWFGVAQRVVARARAMGAPVTVAPDAVMAIRTADYPTAAVRPANSRLDTAKLRRTFAVSLPDWTPGVDDAVDTLVGDGAWVDR